MKRDKQKIQALINDLLALRREGNLPMSIAVMVRLKELALSSGYPLDANTVRSIISELNQQKLSRVDDFDHMAAARSRASSGQNASQQAHWKLLFPFDIKLKDDLPKQKRLKLLGARLSIITRVSAKRTISKALGSDAKKQAKMLVGQPMPFSETMARADLAMARRAIDETTTPFIKCVVWAQDVHEALDTSGSAIELLRGLMTHVYSIGQWVIRSKPVGPRSIIPLPKWCFAIQSGSNTWEFFQLVTPDYSPKKPLPLHKLGFNKIKEMAAPFRSVPDPHSTKDVIVNSFRLQAQALDSSFRHEHFLGLWQVAEAITLSKRTSGATKEVCKRLKWHGKRIGLPGSGFDYILDDFAEKRNNIAHHGVHAATDEDVDVLRAICQEAIRWLWQSHKELPTKNHLNEFYILRTANNKSIRGKKEEYEQMLRMRKVFEDCVAFIRRHPEFSC